MEPKNGTRLAQRSFFMLGIIYTLFGIPKIIPGTELLSFAKLILGMVFAGPLAFSGNIVVSYGFVFVGVALLVAWHLLKKQNIGGVYIGWLFVLGGLVAALNALAFNVLPMAIILYCAYANYKAHKALKSTAISY